MMQLGRSLEPVFLLLWVVALCILSDAHKHKLETSEYLRNVAAVKKEIENFFKQISNISVNVESISSQTKQKSEKDFAKAMKDAKEFHLVRNLGPPSDGGHVDLSVTVKKTKVYPSEEAKSESTVVTDVTGSVSHYPEPQTVESTSDIYESSTHGYPIDAGSIEGIPGVDVSVTVKKTKVYPSEAKPESTVVTDATGSVSHYPEPQTVESTSDIYESSIHGHPIIAGSIKGIPGLNFPDYDDIPITSFTCSNKEYLPGFYADLECGCQVFHVCWPDRRESFLCPVGTIFNQALLACDYWYSSNCSLAPHYYSVNAQAASDEKDENTSSMIDVLLETGHKADKSVPSKSSLITSESVLDFISQFMPVKAKVVVYPETANLPSKIVATASVGEKRKSVSKAKTNQETKSADVHESPRPAKVVVYPETANQPSKIVATASVGEKRKSVSKAKTNQETKSADVHESPRPAKPQNPDDSLHSTVSCRVSDESKDIYHVIAARLNEALENVLKEVKLDASIAKFYPAAENLVKSIRSLLWDTFEPKVQIYPPFNELYDLDLMTKKTFGQLPMLVRYFLKQKCGCVQVKDKGVTGSYKLSPLTQLNPRFIVKPVSEEPVKYPVPPTKPKKQSVTLEFSSTSKLNRNKGSISPQTKKSLQKNYMKLLKIKAKSG